MKDLGILGTAHKLALAAMLMVCAGPNVTCGNQWIVQARATHVKVSQTGPKTTGQPQTDTQNKSEQPKPIRRTSAIDTIRRHMQRLGYSIDESKSKPDMLVSNYSDAKRGKVTIVMVYDKRKEVVDFYIYNFGNVDKAADAAALNKYLLAANDAIIIGAFFVDKDGDIGYKYVSPTSQLSLGSFETIYVTMAGVALDRRPGIRKLIETGKPEQGQKDNSQARASLDAPSLDRGDSPPLLRSLPYARPNLIGL